MDARLNIADTRLNQRWDAYRHDEPDTDTPPAEATHDAALPSPDDSCWQDAGSDIESGDIAQMLGLLGVSTLPGIQIPWQRADAHPDPEDLTHWRPTEWTDLPDTYQTLKTSLATEYPDYLEYISSPEYGPGSTADHSDQCDVNDSRGTDLDQYDVYLSSWPWLPETQPLLDLDTETVHHLLNRYAGQLADSLLATGWDCNDNHTHKGWTDPIPSLLNWQLRHLPLWDDIIDVPSFWDNPNLGVTVRKDSDTLAEYLPTIPTDEPPLEDALLDAFELDYADSLSPTQATYRLHTLLTELASEPLQDDGLTPMSLPGSRNGWQTAYRKLLTPICQYLRSDDDAALDDLPFLSHIPVEYQDNLYIAPVEWLRTHTTDRLHYYPNDRKRWHENEFDKHKEWILLPSPRQGLGGFHQYADALNGTRIDANRPIHRKQLDTETNHPLLDRYRDHLKDREDYILAALDQITDENVGRYREDLQTAIDRMVVVHGVDPLIDEEAGASVYKRGNDNVFLLDATELSQNEIDEEALAWAVALLVNQPSQLDSLTLALDPDQNPDRLRAFWKDQLALVQGEQNIKRSATKLLTALLELPDTPPDIDIQNTAQIIDNEDWTRDKLRTAFHGTPQDLPTDIVTAVKQIKAVLADDLHPIIHRFIDSWAGRPDHDTTWQTLVAQLDNTTADRVIQWLQDHNDLLHPRDRPIDREVQAWARRLTAIFTVWQDTDSYDSVTAWIDAINAQSPTVAWNETPAIPSNIAQSDHRWFHFTDTETIENQLLNPFLQSLRTDLSYGAELAPVLRHYVEENDLQQPSTDSSRSRQRKAGRQVSEILTEQPDALDTLSAVGQGTPVSTTATTSGGGGGSRDHDYTERGELAEVIVLGNVLANLAQWLDANDLDTFRTDFANLRADQDRSESYKWHLISAWNNTIEPCLNSLEPHHITNWQDGLRQIADDTDPHPAVRLLNVTQERGPGYDVLAPFGNTTPDPYHIEFQELRPLPVEVKAVDKQPYRFRLSTNELRQARHFIESDIGYELRLVQIPSDARPTVQSVEYLPHRLDTIDDLRALLEDTDIGTPELGFEELVKGGYVNAKISVEEPV